MAEPTTQAAQIETLRPWLLHWHIQDERIGGHRSDAFSLHTPAGWLLIDPLPLAADRQRELPEIRGIVLTHGNHQRSAWRLRRQLGAVVFAPKSTGPLDEEPDHRITAAELPPGLEAVEAQGFQGACYVGFAHGDGTRVLFCGDLICKDPHGPYRFPVQPGYFDPAAGRRDAERLLALAPTDICIAHGKPAVGNGRHALETALQRG